MEAGVSVKRKDEALTFANICKCSKRVFFLFMAAFFISMLVGASLTFTPSRGIPAPQPKRHGDVEVASNCDVKPPDICPPCDCECPQVGETENDINKETRDRASVPVTPPAPSNLTTAAAAAGRYVYPTKPPAERHDRPPAAAPYLPRESGAAPRVLCMVFTTPGAWHTKAKAVNNTWGKRCHKLHFFYSQGETELPGAVALGVPEGRGHLTAKTRLALDWSYFHYSDSVDWFLKADDDVYMVMENLVHFLRDYDAGGAYYVGKNSGPWHELTHGYCSGGAGYLLSNGAVNKFLKQAEVDMMSCKPNGAFEDADIGACLASMQIHPENTLDEEGRLKFHSDNPLKVLEGRDPAYYIKIYDVEFGTRTAQDRMMSPDAISFHYISPAQMYMYDYLLYDVRKH